MIGPGNTRHLGYACDSIYIRNNRFVDIRNQEPTYYYNNPQAGACISFNFLTSRLVVVGNEFYDVDKPVLQIMKYANYVPYNIDIDSNHVTNFRAFHHSKPGFTYSTFEGQDLIHYYYWVFDADVVIEIDTGVRIGPANVHTENDTNYCFTYDDNDWGVVFPDCHASVSPSLHHLYYEQTIDDCILPLSTAFNNDYTKAPYVPVNISIVPDNNDISGDGLEIEISHHIKFPGNAGERRRTTLDSAEFVYLEYDTTYYARIRNLSTGSCWSEDTFALKTVQDPYENQNIHCWEDYAPNIEVNDDGSLVKVANGAAWDITYSLKHVVGDGYVEWAITDTNVNTGHAIVLSEAPVIPQHYDSGYAMVLEDDGDISIWVDADSIGVLGTYALDDTVRMAKQGDQLFYIQNDDTLHTAPLSDASVELIPGAQIYTLSALFKPIIQTQVGQVLTSIENCPSEPVGPCYELVASHVYGASAYQFRFENVENQLVYELISDDRYLSIADANELLNDKYGGHHIHLRSGREYSVQVSSVIGSETFQYADACTILIDSANTITWRDYVDTNLIVNDDCSLEQIADDLIIHYAISEQKLYGAGYIEWVITPENNVTRHGIVLSKEVDGDPQSYASGFCFLMMVSGSSGQTQAWEGATNQGTSMSYYSLGDTMRIERLADGTIICKLNSDTVHEFTEAVPLTMPLIPAAVMRSHEAVFKPVIMETTYLTAIENCPSSAISSCTELSADTIPGASAYQFRFEDINNEVVYEVVSDDQYISIAEANESLHQQYGGHFLHLRSGQSYDLQVAGIVNDIVCPYYQVCNITIDLAEAITWKYLDTSLTVESDCSLKKSTDEALTWNLALSDRMLNGTAYVEWVITDNNFETAHAIVLAKDGDPQNYQSGFTFLMMSFGKTQAWEGSSNIPNGISTYAIGDTMRIERLPNCQIVCKQNGTIIHDFQEFVPLNQPLYIGALIHTYEASFKPVLVETTFLSEIENCPFSDLLRCGELSTRHIPGISNYVFEIEEEGSNTPYTILSNDNYIGITEINAYINKYYLDDTPEYITSNTAYTIRSASVINGITTPYSANCEITTGDMNVMTWMGLDDPIVVEDPIVLNNDCSLEKIGNDSYVIDYVVAEQILDGAGYVEWIVTAENHGLGLGIILSKNDYPQSYTSGYCLLTMTNGDTQAWEGSSNPIESQHAYEIDDTLRIERRTDDSIICKINDVVIYVFEEPVSVDTPLYIGALLRHYEASFKPVLKSNTTPSKFGGAWSNEQVVAKSTTKVFPNPFRHSMEIVAPAEIKAIVIRSGNGQLISECKDSMEFENSSKTLLPGLYTIHVHTEEATEVFKIVKL